MGLAEAYESSRMYTYAEAAYKDLLKDEKNQPEVYCKLINMYIGQESTKRLGCC